MRNGLVTDDESQVQDAGTREYGDLEIDLGRRVLRVAGTPVFPTKLEWAVLAVLIAHAGDLVSHEQITAEVWGSGYADMRQSLRGHIKGLRAKLGDRAGRSTYIRTENSSGYRWICSPKPPAAITAADTTLAEALHDVNNALTVLGFSLDSALGVARGLPAHELHDGAVVELVDKLDRGVLAARRAQSLIRDLQERSLHEQQRGRP